MPPFVLLPVGCIGSAAFYSIIFKTFLIFMFYIINMI